MRAEAGGDDRVTVIAPVNEPSQGYVVYEDTRRASAGRRLEKTLKALREAGLSAQGFVVETGPVQAVKDALVQLEPAVDEIVVATHGAERSGWMRRDVVGDIERIAGVPVLARRRRADAGGEANVLVIANQTVVSEELLERIRERAGQEPRELPDRRAAERRGASTTRPTSACGARSRELRGEGIDAHGQVVHPDPYTAARHVVNDERVDEIIVSTFPGERSGWLRRDLVQRLRKDTGLPVEHVVAPVRA